jgi:hypothetical protein
MLQRFDAVHLFVSTLCFNFLFSFKGTWLYIFLFHLVSPTSWWIFGQKARQRPLKSVLASHPPTNQCFKNISCLHRSSSSLCQFDRKHTCPPPSSVQPLNPRVSMRPLFQGQVDLKKKRGSRFLFLLWKYQILGAKGWFLPAQPPFLLQWIAKFYLII